MKSYLHDTYARARAHLNIHVHRLFHRISRYSNYFCSRRDCSEVPQFPPPWIQNNLSESLYKPFGRSKRLVTRRHSTRIINTKHDTHIPGYNFRNAHMNLKYNRNQIKMNYNSQLLFLCYVCFDHFYTMCVHRQSPDSCVVCVTVILFSF